MGPGVINAEVFLTQLRQPFADLPQSLFSRLAATRLPDSYVIHVNNPLAERLGLDTKWLASSEGAALFSGSLSGSPDLLASAYAGHQFGVWAGRLGDGRALSFGEWQTPDGSEWELQLKGAGRTPYSRGADGRAVLRSSVREYLCSAAMQGLGIPTTRALMLVGSSQPVYRETEETAAVVTRVAESFIRFGHFEWLSHSGLHDDLRTLADYVIRRFYPECMQAEQPYAALFEVISRRTAQLIARWQMVGFCHGVMNSDNMSILGQTIDYGPFGFLDTFDVQHICNHSDHSGRYAYCNQPQIALWNLHCLGSAFRPLVDDHLLLTTLEQYPVWYEQIYLSGMRTKLGLNAPSTADRQADWSLIEHLLQVMQDNQVDFTMFFRTLCDVEQGSELKLYGLCSDQSALGDWLSEYRDRLCRESESAEQRAAAMRKVNPKYVLRNHLAEQAIRQARQGVFTEISRLMDCLAHPFDEQPQYEAYAGLPPDWAGQLCVSCSS